MQRGLIVEMLIFSFDFVNLKILKMEKGINLIGEIDFKDVKVKCITTHILKMMIFNVFGE